MGCIEIWKVGDCIIEPNEINRNMRCIEILLLLLYSKLQNQINRNMRCIEIGRGGDLNGKCVRINRNMRCIEMWYARKQKEKSKEDKP